MQVGLSGVERHAGAGQLDRGRHQLGPGEARKPAVGGGEPGRHPGNGDGRGADMEDLRRARVEDDVDRAHLSPLTGWKPLSRDGGEEVEQTVGTFTRLVHEHEPSSTGPGRRALGHPGDESRGDAGVDGVPSLGEDACARLGGQRVTGGHCALHGQRVARPICPPEWAPRLTTCPIPQRARAYRARAPSSRAGRGRGRRSRSEARRHPRSSPPDPFSTTIAQYSTIAQSPVTAGSPNQQPPNPSWSANAHLA